MADIWKALPYYLTHFSALSALVSDRIYPIRLPQNVTLPAVVYQDISATYTQAHNTASALPMPRFQFTVYAGTIDKANQVCIALKSALDGFRGSIGVSPYTTEVQASILKNEITNDDPQLEIYQRIQDYLIQYKS